MKINKTLDAAQARLLQTLIGSEFLFVGGENLPDYLVSDSLVVSTSGASVLIMGDVEEQALGPDSLDDFAFLVVKPATEGLLEHIRNAGKTYLIDKRSVIRGMSVIRENRSSSNLGFEEWSLLWDSALIIYLEVGEILITFGSMGMEILQVHEYSGDSPSNYPIPVSWYEDDLQVKLSVQREIIPIQELAGNSNF